MFPFITVVYYFYCQTYLPQHLTVTDESGPTLVLHVISSGPTTCKLVIFNNILANKIICRIYFFVFIIVEFT